MQVLLNKLKSKRKRIVRLFIDEIKYFLAMKCIPRSTTNKELIELQVLNGNELLEKHLSEGPSNAQYTSRFSARVLIEAIDIWIERKLMCTLQESPHFSILADESQDISTQDELSICDRWLVNGKPAEHLVTVLHVCSTDAGTIAEALQSFLQQKQLDLRRLIGQGWCCYICWEDKWSS